VKVEVMNPCCTTGADGMQNTAQRVVKEIAKYGESSHAFRATQMV
jgi:hypothetical protein